MKLRTHKTTAKRFKILKSGKVMQTTTSAQHLRHNKSRRQLKAAKDVVATALVNVSKIKKLLPYS